MSRLAFAHPPSKIEVVFDAETKILTAKIIHPVENPLNHYIAKVDVSINGEEVLTQHISRQDNNTEQAVSYRIPDVKQGDTVSVEGHCSISGTKEETIKIQ